MSSNASGIRRLIVLITIAGSVAMNGCRLEQYFDDMNINEHGMAGDEEEDRSPNRVHGGII